MAKYVIDESTLKGLADALRSVTGETRTYTPTEMVEAVTNIMDSAMYILVDENGDEIPAVYVENEAVFTATANDIRIGTVAATDKGVVTGTKEIPAYHTNEGYKLILANRPMVITAPQYDYTKLQAIICSFNTSLSNSVAAEKVSIENRVYDVRSSTVLSEVTKDDGTKSIDLGIINTSDKPCLIRFILYKEIY